MDKFDRIQQLHRALSSARRPVPVKKLAEQWECSEKTVQRAVDTLRDYLNAPLEYDSERRGWYYNLGADDSVKFELPGLWLTAEEIECFAALLTLLRGLDTHDISPNFGLIEQSIDKLLRGRGVAASTFHDKIKYLATNKRLQKTGMLAKVVDALNQNKRLCIVYCDYRGQRTQRQVSPQTLVHYMENWYLDAWCHLRQDLRSFMLPRIEKAQILAEPCKQIDRAHLDDYFSSAYGIFAGKATYRAEIHFYEEAAREATSRQWHPQQQLTWRQNTAILQVPYHDDRELIRDILKYGDNAQVVAPESLRRRMAEVLRRAVERYR